jgi:hypothetical protein
VTLLVAIPLLIVAIVGLPLFQDGSSYLLELMTSHSAIRHHRYAVLLVQAPSIVALKLSALAGLDPRSALHVVRAVFNVSHAILPLVALAWSWLLVRERDPAMMIWAAAPILMLNVVNFSAVSEILLATQLAFPLLLAASLERPTRFANATILLLTSIILLLHALVAVLFMGLACGMALRARRLDAPVRRAWNLAALFAGAAVARLVLDAWLSTDYEKSMWGGALLVDYFSAGFETACFLVIAMGSVLWFGFRRQALQRVVVVVSMGLTALTFGMALRNLNEVREFDEQPILLLALFGVTLIAMMVHAICRPAVTQPMSTADRAVFVLLWSAAGGIITRYALLESFPLKTGATILIGAVLLALAAIDSMRDHPPAEERRRARFVLNAAAIFAVLVLSKAAVWAAANTKLAQTAASSATACVEIDDVSMDWVRRSPGSILNNWSLPTLYLVSARERPAGLLLEAGDCERFAQSGEIVVDPWTVLTPRQLPFVFGGNPDARHD